MRRAFILIAAALMLSACCGRNSPAEVAVIPQPQVVETGRSTVVLRAGEYDVVRSLDSTMRASSYFLTLIKKESVYVQVMRPDFSMLNRHCVSWFRRIRRR